MALLWGFFLVLFYIQSILERHRTGVNLIFLYYDKISDLTEIYQSGLNLKYMLSKRFTMGF